MKNLNVKKLFVPGVYLVAVISVIACIVLTITSINKYLSEKRDFTYSVNGLIDEDSVPVQGEENKDNENPSTSDKIIRPYKSEGVTIGRYFYDFEAEAKNQENAIIYYENTYMQNSGVDYISEEAFEVLSVLNGKVLSVETDEVLGNIVKIEHEKEFVTVYQGIDKVELKVGDNVTQGQVIGKSGNSSINSNYKTSLHFEVYYKGTLMDPENFYTLNLKEL
jgi:stage II sporulation protein Q